MLGDPVVPERSFRGLDGSDVHEAVRGEGGVEIFLLAADDADDEQPEREERRPRDERPPPAVHPELPPALRHERRARVRARGEEDEESRGVLTRAVHVHGDELHDVLRVGDVARRRGASARTARDGVLRELSPNRSAACRGMRTESLAVSFAAPGAQGGDEEHRGEAEVAERRADRSQRRQK